MIDVKLKICGMRESENIRQVAALHPDYMGFIFYEKSPRFVGENFTLPEFDKSVKRVGVFVNESADVVLKQVTKHSLDFVQLHGDESVEYCELIKSKGIKVIKVFRMNDAFDFNETKRFELLTDYFLFDTKGKNYGGNALAFDWNLLKKYNQKIPFFLSGGLTLNNLDEIEKLQDFNLHALDVNSGVELSPGMKDINKVKEIFNRVRV